MNPSTNKPTPILRATGPEGSSPLFRPAFSLTEILVVIVIIVLILGMAMPVFKYMNGSRSQAGATNQIAAFLSRARNDAIGLQIPTGVAFYVDASTGRTAMAEVQRQQDVGFPIWFNPTVVYSRGAYASDTIANVTHYYVFSSPTSTNSGSSPSKNSSLWTECDINATDQIPGTDTELLPSGIGVQLINNAVMTAATTPVRQSDGYVSTGAIFFDANGRLTSLPISFVQGGAIGTNAGFTSLAIRNLPVWKNATTPGTPVAYFNNDPNNASLTLAMNSQFGIAVYDRDAFASNGYNTLDPTYTKSSGYASAYGTANSSPPSEADEENWLDKNASPLLINRYNGTLLRND